MQKQVTTLKIDDGTSIEIPINYQEITLTYSDDPESFGYTRDEVLYILQCIKDGNTEKLDIDENLMNDIGVFFENGICTQPNIETAVYWYEQAVEHGNDFAKSNLADILRKGSQEYPKDLKRAFNLYKDCGLPYAHYRTGEFYEHGWEVDKNLDMAKAYYRQAYKEGHSLANKKLKEWNFLE